MPSAGTSFTKRRSVIRACPRATREKVLLKQYLCCKLAQTDLYNHPERKRALSRIWLLWFHELFRMPGSSVQAILQTRILEWVVIPSPGELPTLPNLGIEPRSPALQGDALPTVLCRKLDCLSNYPPWVTVISLLFTEYPEKPDTAVKCYVASQRQCQWWKEEPAGKQILSQRHALPSTQGCRRQGPDSPGHRCLQLDGLQHMAMVHLQLEQLKGLLTPDTAPSNVDILFQNELWFLTVWKCKRR